MCVGDIHRKYLLVPITFKTSCNLKVSSSNTVPRKERKTMLGEETCGTYLDFKADIHSGNPGPGPDPIKILQLSLMLCYFFKPFDWQVNFSTNQNAFKICIS